MCALRRALLSLLLFAAAAPAWSEGSISILERRALALEASEARPSHQLSLALAYFDVGWSPEEIHAAVRKGARILAQCGVTLAEAELVLIAAPKRFRDFHTPASRELARELGLPKPTIYFVADTRQQPAFEAEAVGRGNSGTRPELRDTVWITRGARDLEIVLAHELAHVLMDSGAHAEEPENLMRVDTTPRNTRLTEAQCTRLRETATANGLLRPVAPGSR